LGSVAEKLLRPSALAARGPIPPKRMGIPEAEPLAEKSWISDADSSAFCQLSLSEDVIQRNRMGIRHTERVPKNV
jgi:hypothetical protein